MTTRPIEVLDTRFLETNEVKRVFVKSGKVANISENQLRLDTAGLVRYKKRPPTPSSPEKAVVPGVIQLDFLTDSIVRIRYAQEAEISDNKTPMVVGQFPSLKECRIEQDNGQITCKTQKYHFKLSLEPVEITVSKIGDDAPVCTIGGQEKNHFRQWDSFNTGVCTTLQEANPIAVENFTLHPHEAVYGFGEKFLRLNKVGQTVDLNMRETQGTSTPRTYKNIPFFMTTRGYGVYINHSSRITCWVGSMVATDIQIGVEDDFLDYYLILGDMKEILTQYTDITGKGIMPPDWSFGYWQSKISYKSAEETLDIARHMREAEIPMDVIHLDTFWFKEDWYCDLEFDKERFPDPAGYLAELREMGVKVSLWQLPYIPEGSSLFNDLTAAEGFVKDSSGGMYDIGISFTPGFEGKVGCIDFTNPKAIEIYQAYLHRLFELGVKVIKVDFGEQAPLDGVYYDGTPGHRAHNLYPLVYNKAVSEVTKASTGEQIIWARSTWAGSQRYPVHWGGDSSCNWNNMIPQIEAGLSFGLSGFQFWSQDIGGFLGETGGNLLIRWMQMSMFLSHTRIHGSGKRELYRFDDKVRDICRDFIQLRYRLLPYIWSMAQSCVEQSLPMARALVLEFQDDPNVWHIGDQWMFGDSIMVAPIADETNKRELYLPQGQWTDWWTGESLAGGQWINVKADIDKIPLYLREGALIPMGPVMNYVGEVPMDKITLRVVPYSEKGNTSINCALNGENVKIEYKALPEEHLVTVSHCDIQFSLEVFGRSDAKVILQMENES